MTRATHKCFDCKQDFLTSEMVYYASPSAKNMHWYCKKCLEEKKLREMFFNQVCKIFGIKAPGPRIWTERKRLRDNYGYTDNVIIDCLDYIYNVENKKKLVESLTLITPEMVNRMKLYQKKKQTESIKLTQAMQQEVKEHIVPIKENKEKKKIDYDPDEWLD